MANERMSTGFDGVLSYAVDATPSGDPALASLVEMTFVRDTNVKITVDKVEQTDRSSRYKQYCAGMLEAEITTTVTYNATTQPFIEHCLDRLTGTVGILDKTGGEGLYFHCQVFQSDLSQPLSDGQTVNLTFCPIRTVDFVEIEEPTWA